MLDRDNEPEDPEPTSQETKTVELQDNHCEDEVVEEMASTNLLDITNLVRNIFGIFLNCSNETE